MKIRWTRTVFCLLAATMVLLAGPVAQAKGRASVRSEELGKTVAGETVHVFTLTNRNGLEAKLLDFGATIYEVNAPDRNGAKANVVLQLSGLGDYEKFNAVNSVVGRYANRLKNGFTVGGKHYDLPSNPAGVNIHSSPNSYYKRVWTAQPIDKNVAAVSFTLDSPDGDQGFPGHLQVKVTYRLTEADELRLDYAATTDKDTVINFTNHVYFNLAGDLTKSIFEQQLQVNAAQFTELDKDNVPTGKLLPVAGTALDFRTMQKVGARIAEKTAADYSVVRGYDFNWVIDAAARGEKAVAVRMADPASGRVLEIRTTEPGVQIFSMPGIPASVKAAGGVTAARGPALALETQHYPDSPNHPEFPTTELRAGQSFRSVTVFRFTTDKKK